MHHVEASGKSREEAIQNALNDLGVEMHDVENIEVLDEGSKGLFGFGARPVSVRVSVERLPRKAEPRNRDRGENRPARPRREEAAPKPANGEENAERGERNKSRNGKGRNERDRNARPKQERPAGEERPARAPRPRREERTDQQPANGDEAPAPRSPRRARETEGIDDVAREAASFEPISDEQGNEAAALLTEVIAKMGMVAEVAFERNPDQTARLTVKSEDGAILIGRKGRTLSALQYLINRIISRTDTAENTERLVVDVEGYVDRRRESLEELARNFAEKVKASGRNYKLKPMSPQERRIIHLTLQEDPEIRTFSLGESLYRTVVISPANSEGPRSGSRNRGRGGSRGRGGRGRKPAGQGARRPEGDTDAGVFGD